MLRSVTLAAACLFIGSLSQPLAGQSSDKSISSTEAVDPASAIFETLYGGEPGEALRVIDRILADEPTVEQKAILRSLRASALLGLDRKSDAESEFAAAAALATSIPEPVTLQFVSGVVFNDLELAGKALDRLAAVFPDAARNLDEQLVFGYLEGDPGKKSATFNRQRIALARIGYGGAQGDYLTLTAVELLLAEQNEAEAAELVRTIDDRYVLQRALITRKFSPIWATIESHAGLHMTRVNGLAVELAKRERSESPDDPDKLAHLITTLRRAKRYDEAIAVGASYGATAAELSALPEYGGWAVNNHAFALFAAKRYPESDARIGGLVEANQSSWIVSMAINRAEMLLQRGAFAEVLHHIPVAEKQARENGNPYARQLVRRLKMCGLHRLGRIPEAAAVQVEVKKFAQDAPAATVEGLLCVGDLDAAAQIAVQTLTDGDKATEMLMVLQRIPLDDDDPSTWMEPASKLRNRPEVAAAFDRAGRDLPESMWSQPAN